MTCVQFLIDECLAATKSNMWSDVKGVDISLDLSGKKASKPAAPSMNQLQGDSCTSYVACSEKSLVNVDVVDGKLIILDCMFAYDDCVDKRCMDLDKIEVTFFQINSIRKPRCTCTKCRSMPLL